MLQQIQKAVNFLNQKINVAPQIGVVLGSGLGSFADDLEVLFEIDYHQIPHFPVSTVEGHSGKLVYGKLHDKYVIALKGRFHFYEGYSMQHLTFPIRVFKLLGIKLLMLSNASGGVNPNFEIGDIMLINDHINLLPSNPLIGKNIDELGPRFPDMSEPYSFEILKLAKQIGEEEGIKLQEGVYAALSGPTYETKSEYKYIHIIGADAVGMSTVPEVIVARHMNLPCFAVSVITDLGVPGKIVEVSHEEVQKIAAATTPKVKMLFSELIKRVVL
ncbi:MAG: purine-nucleoside phosphorylase [Vicingaceae bacterium]